MLLGETFKECKVRIKKMAQIRLGLLASGEGTSVEALVERIYDGKLTGFVESVVICNRPRGNAGVYDVAEELGLPIEYSASTRDQLNIFKEEKVDMVLGLGYLGKVGISMLEYFGNRIWNIHPTLLPRHGGEGMHGLAVHKAVIESGDKETGATIRIMNENYDDGQILTQVTLQVFPGETPEMLQQRVLPHEYALMAGTLALYRDNLLLNCPRKVK